MQLALTVAMVTVVCTIANATKEVVMPPLVNALVYLALEEPDVTKVMYMSCVTTGFTV